MRILQVYPYFYPAWMYGGVTRVVYEMSKHLADRRHEVSVYTTDAFDKKSRIKISSHPYYINGVRTYYFKNMSNYLAYKHILALPIGMFFRTKKEIKEFDVIHLHGSRTFLNIIIHHYANKYNIPYVLQAYGSVLPTFQKQRLKKIFDLFFGYRILKDASKVIALTKTEAEQYKKMGVDEDKIEIVPSGIDLSKFEDLPKRGEFRKKYLIRDDEKVILYLGRIHKAKGIDFLIRAYSLLVKGMNVEDVLLMISGSDYGHLRKVKSLANSLGVGKKTIFTGSVDESEKAMAFIDSSIVVNVEPHNVFGLVPLEAAACSKPVIVSKGNAISEVISQGDFGFSVQYGNVAELANAMRNVLFNDDLLKKMGMRGREFVFKNFGWDLAGQKYENVYDKVLKEKR